jgi:hypothetical protein
VQKRLGRALTSGVGRLDRERHKFSPFAAVHYYDKNSNERIQKTPLELFARMVPHQ